MPYSNLNLIPTYASIILISSLLLGGSFLMISAYADEDEDEDYKDDIDQDVKQKQECKIGVFGDPQDSVSSTVQGLCNQQAQNNVDSDSSLGGIGISTGQ
jgi:hypothetical protein